MNANMNIFCNNTPQQKVDNYKDKDKDKKFCIFAKPEIQEKNAIINLRIEENKDKEDSKDKEDNKDSEYKKNNNENEDNKNKKEIINIEKNEDEKENKDIKDNRKNEDNKDIIENNSKRKNNLYKPFKKDNNRTDIIKEINNNENNDDNGNENGLNLNQFISKTQIHSRKKNNFLKQSINLNMFENKEYFSKGINGNDNNNEGEDKKINIKIKKKRNNDNDNNKINENNLNENNDIINNGKNIRKKNTLDFDNKRRNYNSNRNSNNIKNNIKNLDNNCSNLDDNKDNNNKIDDINNINNINNININNNIDANELNRKDSDDLKIKKKDDSSKLNNPGVYGSFYPNQNNFESIKRKKSQETKKKEILEDESRAQVKDHLKCYICFNNIIKPRMCKFCKKLACEKCIKNWLENKKICAFCRKNITFNDTIYIPLLEEVSNFFIKQAEKEPIKEEESYNSAIAFSKSVVDKKENLNECKTHHNIYEYYCANCSKNYCSKCLNMFEASAKIHENHTIIPIKLLENKDIKDTVEEFKKLFISKDNLEKLIKLCNLKIKEMEIEKNQHINNIDQIKKNIFDRLDIKLVNLRNKYNSIKIRDEELTKAIETTPFALKNIVKLKDHGQGEKIYEHLCDIKRQLKNTEYIADNSSKTKIKLNSVESFTSELFEFILPDNGKYVDGRKVFFQKLDNFIPENECHISLKYNGEYICFNIHLINSKNKAKQDKVKYYGFIIIRNQEYDCEFVLLEDKINFDKHILSTEFSSNHFISFKDENNKIRFKIYITKQEKK